MPPYKDLGDLEEDERITQIGEKTMKDKMTVGFITDADPGKADRYTSKLLKRFPGIRVVYQGKGPVADTILVKVAPPVN